jgi:predicted MFS family arabinose efflux permease
VLLIFVCFGYCFSRSLLPENIAFIIVSACFLFDQMLISVSMARSTYIKKIARQASDIQPALTVAVTIDHFFSITAALVGGLIWNNFGFQYVFLMGAGIAVINFFAALRVRVPDTKVAPPAQGPVTQEIV